jgi:hypothetical protein
MMEARTPVGLGSRRALAGDPEVRGGRPVHRLGDDRHPLTLPEPPISPIRAQRTPVNRINKPRKPTGTPPVTPRRPPVTTKMSNASRTVTRRQMGVIRCTPVSNKA